MDNDPRLKPPAAGIEKPNLVYFLAILSAWQKDSLHTMSVLSREQPPPASTPPPKKP
jgi:hypothetical protein